MKRLFRSSKKLLAGGLVNDLKYILFLICVFAQICFNAQDLNYLRRQAKALSSQEMKGRGYVQDGQLKAASYIHHQFDSLGLKSFHKDYCQKFELAVNTFPNELLIEIEGQTLLPGEDYILDSSSGSSTGTFDIFIFDKTNISDIPDPGQLVIPGKKIILVLDPSGIQDKDSLHFFQNMKYSHSNFIPVIWLNDKKLTWSVSREQAKNAIVEIKKDSFDREANKIKVDVKAKMKTKFQAMNMLGYIKGKQSPDSFIVFTAHYDHLGMMGEKACFYGANDNASGTAYLLELARHYSSQKNKYTMVFIAFAGEEAGLVGSKFYVDNPLFPLDKIKFLVNIDLMGFGDEGITVVNGTLFEKEFKWLTEINSQDSLLAKVKIRGPAANSDHYWFSQKGVPSFFIYTLGGNKAYHDIYDRYENLTFVEFRDLFKLLTRFIHRFD